MSVSEAVIIGDRTAPVSGLFRWMSDAALMVSLPDLEVLAANSACQALIGLPECQLRGQSVLDLLTGLPSHCLPEACIGDSQPTPIECFLQTVAGKHCPITILVVSDESSADSVIIILRQRTATEDADLAQTLLDEAQAVAGVGWWSWHADTQDFRCSKSMLDLFNVPKSERGTITLETLMKRLVPEDHPRIQQCWHRATSIGMTTSSEYRVVLPDNELRYLQSSARPVAFDDDGHPKTVVGMVRDVTVYARNRDLEAATRKELDKLCEVLAAADGFVWEWNVDTQLFEFVSPEVVRILGYPVERWLTEPEFFRNVILEEDRDRVLGFCADRTQMGLHHTMEYRMVDTKGDQHWIRDYCFIKRDAVGRISHLHGMMIDITERIRASELMRKGDERYQRLFYESPISLWELDCSVAKSALNELQASGIENVEAWLLDHPQRAAEIANTIKVLDVNRGTLTMFEANSADDFFRNIGGIFREESLPPYIGWLASLARGDASYDFENALYSLKTGKRMICSIRSRVARGCEETYSLTYSAVDNITERRHTEHLQESHRRILELIAARRPLSQIVEALLGEIELLSPYLHATLILPEWDEDSPAETYAGARYERVVRSVLGDINPAYLPQTSDEVGVLQVHEIFVPTNQPDGGESVASIAVKHALVNCGINHCATVRVGSSDHSSVGMLLVMSSSTEFPESLQDAVKSFSHVTGVALEHAQAVGELMLRTAELQSVFGAYPDKLLRVSSDGEIIERFGSDYMRSLLYQSGSPAMNLWSAVDLPIANRFRDAMGLVALGSQVENVEFSVDRDGKKHSLEARFVPLPNSHDQMVVIRDITRMKEAEAALLHANHQFQRLFDQSPDAIFVETFGGIVLDANRAACELHQMDRDELIGRHVFELVPEDERDRVVRTTADMTGDRTTEFEGSSLRKDGMAVPISGRASKIEYGGRPALLLHVRDISEQRRQQELKYEQDRRMSHVSRLTMMGQLVAGIAHEIRQPLWSTNTFADVCIELLNQPNSANNIDRIRELMTKLSSAARRASEITTRMLSFARKGQPERTKEQLGSLISAAVELASPRIRSSNVELHVESFDHLPEIRCDRVLIEQTIVNLINNACQALANKPYGSREIRISANVDELEAVICVADNGPGLPTGVEVEQLFESFFTTERSGTGIGLALSRSFVEEHGGRIRAKINSSGGMTFEFTLKL